jgi:hypothetical protein
VMSRPCWYDRKWTEERALRWIVSEIMYL